MLKHRKKQTIACFFPPTELPCGTPRKYQPLYHTDKTLLTDLNKL